MTENILYNERISSRYRFSRSVEEPEYILCLFAIDIAPRSIFWNIPGWSSDLGRKEALYGISPSRRASRTKFCGPSATPWEGTKTGRTNQITFFVPEDDIAEHESDIQFL